VGGLDSKKDNIHPSFFYKRKKQRKFYERVGRDRLSKGGINSGNPILYPDTKRQRKENSMSG